MSGHTGRDVALLLFSALLGVAPCGASAQPPAAPQPSASPVHPRPFFTGAYSGALASGTIRIGPSTLPQAAKSLPPGSTPQVADGTGALYYIPPSAVPAPPKAGPTVQPYTWPLTNNPYANGNLKPDPAVTEGITDCKAGDADVGRGSWADAAAQYKQALALCPTNPTALYGLAACRHAVGDVGGELAYYRAAIYTTTLPPYSPIVREMDLERLMKFVVLLCQAGLSQAGQPDEALALYNRAADWINYDHGKQRHEVLLPEFGLSPGQSAYTPDRLQAMAHVAVAIQAMGFDDRETLPHLQDALKLMPDSAVANFYLGKYLLGRNGAAAKAALEKAVQSGDDPTARAANLYLDYFR